jgi:hypothetical protein
VLGSRQIHRQITGRPALIPSTALTSRLPNVARIHSSFALRTVCKRGSPPRRGALLESFRVRKSADGGARPPTELRTSLRESRSKGCAARSGDQAIGRGVISCSLDAGTSKTSCGQYH